MASKIRARMLGKVISRGYALISENDARGGNSRRGRESYRCNERKPKSVCNLTMEKTIMQRIKTILEYTEAVAFAAFVIGTMVGFSALMWAILNLSCQQ